MIHLDQLVLDSVARKLPTNIGEQMILETVNRSFARTLCSAAYPCYRHLKIEVDPIKTPREHASIRMNLSKELNSFLASYTTKDPIKCLAALFARFSNIISLSTDSIHQWEINEMIMRAVISVKCDLPKIKQIFMDIPYIAHDDIIDYVQIGTPALFADSLDCLRIENHSMGTFRDTAEYFGKYTSFINVRQLILDSVELPTSDCLNTSFGHMSNLNSLFLKMPFNCYPLLSSAGLLEFLSKLGVFHLEMAVDIGEEDDLQVDAYIYLCNQLPPNVILWLYWENNYNYETPEELAGQIACALKISSSTRANVNLKEETVYSGEGSKKMFLQCAERACQIVQRDESDLTITFDLKNEKRIDMLLFQVDLKGKSITFSFQ